MALVKIGSRFPISTDLIGPWGDLLARLDSVIHDTDWNGLLAAVQTAKQQVVTLRNMLDAIQSQQQVDATSIAALTARVLALESAPSSAASFSILDEKPAGTMNGVNDFFSLSAAPRLLLLELNGQELIPGSGNDYTLTGATIRYVAGKIPAATDVHRARGLV